MAAIRKIKAERNGDIIIPTELARLAGVMPNMEVHIVIKDKGTIELMSEYTELKQAATLQEMLDILERQGDIKLHKPQKNKRVLTQQQRQRMRQQLNESLRDKSLPVEEIIEKERQERDDLLRL
jgi:hypothetical protein